MYILPCTLSYIKCCFLSALGFRFFQLEYNLISGFSLPHYVSHVSIFHSVQVCMFFDTFSNL